MGLKAKKLFVVIGLALFMLPQLTVAQTPIPDGGQPGAGAGTSDALCPSNNYERINGLCLPKQEGAAGSIKAASTVFQLIQIVLRWLLTFAGIIATVFLIIGGYQYMTSAGNEEAAEKGKKTLINSFIGIVVVVLAITIVTIVTNTLGSSNPVG